jgi:hypothetical protein
LYNNRIGLYQLTTVPDEVSVCAMWDTNTLAAQGIRDCWACRRLHRGGTGASTVVDEERAGGAIERIEARAARMVEHRCEAMGSTLEAGARRPRTSPASARHQLLVCGCPLQIAKIRNISKQEQTS